VAWKEARFYSSAHLETRAWLIKAISQMQRDQIRPDSRTVPSAGTEVYKQMEKNGDNVASVPGVKSAKAATNRS
jgi:hypothetical protein